MGKLNKTPIGLLSLLESKTEGTNPSELGELVRPTVDLLPFWSTDLTAETFSGPFAGLDSEVGVLVPDGEVWLVQSAHITARATVISEGYKMGLKFTGPINQNGVVQDVFFATDVTSAANLRNTQATMAFRLSHFFQRPVILRAGQGIAGHLQDFLLSGTLNATCAVMKVSLVF